MKRDEGSASVEFLTLGVLLLVPLVYLVLTLSALQGASFAASGAARQAARVLALAPSDAEGRQRAAAAARIAMDDWRSGAGRVELSCAPHPDRCITPGGRVTASVRISVPLPFLPAAVRVGEPGTIQIGSSAVETVSRFAVVP